MRVVVRISVHGGRQLRSMILPVTSRDSCRQENGKHGHRETGRLEGISEAARLLRWTLTTLPSYT